MTYPPYDVIARLADDKELLDRMRGALAREAVAAERLITAASLEEWGWVHRWSIAATAGWAEKVADGAQITDGDILVRVQQLPLPNEDGYMGEGDV